MRARSFLTLASLIALAPLAACASSPPSGYATARIASGDGAGPGPGPVREDDGLLPEPPANARAGQCFAKVVVPGQPVYGPPSGPHLKWVQSPPQPGTIGPVWCQVWEQGYEPTISYTPERYGWIRVICDKDATREKIGHIQRRLHDWGYYNGGYGGEYDQSTAEAVKHFQAERRIEHGGYLSYKTMEMLETAPPAPAPPPIQPPVTYAQGYAGGAAYGYGYGYTQQAYPPPSPCGPAPCQPPMVYPPSPCGPAPCQAPPQPCGPQPCQGGYGQWGGYGQMGGQSSGGRRFLTWSGKDRY